MKAYRVSGVFKMGLNKNQKFTKECAAEDEKKAVEYIYSILGSKHYAKRKEIKIEKIEPVDPKEVKDPVAKFKLGM